MTPAADPRPLAVGLNLVFLGPGAAGVGRYATELPRALLAVEPDTRLTAFVSRSVPESLFTEPWSERVEWVRLPVDVPSRIHLAAQLAAVPALAARRRLDVVHSPANVGPLATPGAARVLTVHDVIFLHQGERWESARAARAMRIAVAACAHASHRVIAGSASARDDIASSLGIRADKIDVVVHGVRTRTAASVAAASVRRRFDLCQRRIVLCVAQKRPYKNLAALVRAVPDLDDDVVLVLPGASTPYEADLRSLAEGLGVGGRVRFLGWIGEAELEALYDEASCFVLPSLIEGFGMPVLEAMARGVPVACSNRPALPEVVGDAALLFDPEDQAAVTGAVRRLLADRTLAGELVARGRLRCRAFTWERTAEATLASYRRALAARASRARRLRLAS